VKPSPRLRLEPRPSRIGCIALGACCVATAMLIVLLPLDTRVTAGALVAVAWIALRGFRRCAGRDVPALLHVGLDRRITATSRDGRSRDGAILDDSCVGSFLTTIVWRPDAARWFEPARSIVLLPDSLPAEDYRRLRVLLRYGRPAATEAPTSGLDAA
jgi:hypothetical protein